MSNQLVSHLYNAVLRQDVCSNAVTEKEIKLAIENMTEVYKPRLNSLSSTEKLLADYNSLAHRCAYLHKYAASHTAIVRDVLVTVLNQDEKFFRYLSHKLTTSMLKICSLGGGPGSDIIGIIAALSQIFVFQCSAKVVDLKSDWEHTLWSVVQELRCRDYGLVGQCFREENFRWEYLEADLLDNRVKDDVRRAIGDADWLTMVKFVSAASCKSTETMLMKIFSMLKPGAIILFIDNAAGGFSELVSNVSRNFSMRYIIGPINHKIYSNEDLKVNLWGKTSCYQTKLTIHMMQKLGKNRESNSMMPLSKWNMESNFNANQTRGVREIYPVNNPAVWNENFEYALDESGWVRERHSLQSQVEGNIYLDFNSQQSVWNSKTDPIHQSTWIQESNHTESQSGHNQNFNYIDQSRWIEETMPSFVPRPIEHIETQACWNTNWYNANQARLVNESNPIEVQAPIPGFTSDQIVWDTWEEAHTITQAEWDRESKSLLPRPVCEEQLNFSENTHPEFTNSQSEWVRERTPLLPIQVWNRQPNFAQDQIERTKWNIQQNPMVARSRWNRGRNPHSGSMRMKQRKFNSNSIKIGHKKKFHNNSIQMRQRIKSKFRL